MSPKSYDAEGITVRFEPRRCIHAAECVRGLPSVFDSAKRPWIQPDGADVDAIVRVVERCPSGALTYERRDGGPAEVVPDRAVARMAKHGPIYVRGPIEVHDSRGQPVETGPRVALCRCGASKNKPFCDRSHLEVGFRDPAPEGGDAGEEATSG